jgi:hypothetical protein
LAASTTARCLYSISAKKIKDLVCDHDSEEQFTSDNLGLESTHNLSEGSDDSVPTNQV